MWTLHLIKLYYRITIGNCRCNITEPEDNMSLRDWIKDTSCMYHWMRTKYYQEKLNGR